MAIMAIIIFVSVFWILDVNGLRMFDYIGEQLEAQDTNLVKIFNPESAVYYSGLAVFGIFFLEFTFAGQPQLFNKVLALQNPSDLRKMIITYVLLTVAFLGVIFGGFYLRVLNPDLEVADQAVFVYVVSYFPPLIAAFLGVVILAAALSTTDGLVVVLATAVANDIFLKFLVSKDYINIDDARAEIVARYLAQATTVLVGITGVLIVLQPPPNLGLLFWFGVAGVASATVAPVLLGIYFPTFVTRKAAIASLVSGFTSYLVITQVLAVETSVFLQGTYALIVSFIVMVITSVFTEQEEGVGVAAHQFAKMAPEKTL